MWSCTEKFPEQTFWNKKTAARRHYFISNFLRKLRPRSSQGAGELDSSRKVSRIQAKPFPASSSPGLPRKLPGSAGAASQTRPWSRADRGVGLSRPGVANTALGDGPAGACFPAGVRGGCQADRVGLIVFCCCCSCFLLFSPHGLLEVCGLPSLPAQL